MKTLRLSLLVSVLALTSAAVFAEAPAVKTTSAPMAKTSDFSPALVDITKIIDSLDPAKSQSLEWRDSMESLQKSLEKEQKTLQDLQGKIETKRLELEARTKKGEEVTKEEQTSLMTMFQDLQGRGQQLQTKAEAQFTQIQKDFKTKIDAAMKVVGDKNGQSIIYKDVFAYAHNIPDVTSQIVTELNTKYAAEKRAKKMTSEAPSSKAKA